MRKLWKRKWLILAGALVIALSMGTVAWAVAGPDGDLTEAPAPTTLTQASNLVGSAGLQLPAEARQRIQKGKERVEQWMARHQAIIQLIREKMTPEDQATLDRLTATAKEQRQALKEARESLVQTLKELRALTDKYLEPSPTITTTATQ